MRVVFHRVFQMSMERGDDVIQDVTRNVMDGFEYCEKE